jgi:hypothetical protein
LADHAKQEHFYVRTKITAANTAARANKRASRGTILESAVVKELTGPRIATG